MEPHDPERISLYLDDELPAAERLLVEAHLHHCDRCRATLDAFSKLRELLRSQALPATPIDRLAQQRALREILRGQTSDPFWRRPVTLPAPGLAALIAALGLSIGALIAERSALHPPPTEVLLAPGTTSGMPTQPKTPNGAIHPLEGFDPTRFDGGLGLEVYVAEHPLDEGR